MSYVELPFLDLHCLPCTVVFEFADINFVVYVFGALSVDVIMVRCNFN